MRKPTNFDLYILQRLSHPDLAEKFGKSGKAWDIAFQIASLRKKSGLSQKELAKRVGTSQQQISRLESPSYKGHSLSMLRRVADILGANVHVTIKVRNRTSTPVVSEDKAAYRGRCMDFRKREELQKFEYAFLRKGKVLISKNFQILEALYKEAVSLGIIPLKNPLDGIEVDLKIARVVNSV